MKPLHLLIVEDMESDAALMVRYFRSSSYDVKWTRVEVLEEVDVQLSQGNWDVVISDFKLAGFDAFDVLKSVKAYDIDMPFILVSGTVGEEVAVNLMKAGAQDCLTKGNLHRLEVVVDRELAEADIRRKARKAAQELREERQRYELAVRGSSDGIWDWKITENTIYFSGHYRELLGYPAEEFTGDSGDIDSSIHPQDRTRFMELREAHLTHRTPFSIECRLATLHQGFRWFLVRGQALWGPDGGATRMSGSLSDIHLRKEAEEAERRLQHIVESGREMVISVNSQGKLIYFNNAARKGLKLPEGQDISTLSIPQFHRPEVAEFLLTKAIPHCLQHGYWEGDTAFIALDGSELIAHQTIVAHYDEDEQLTQMSTVLIDITERKLAEQRVQELNRSLSDFQQALYDSSIVTRCGVDGVITFVNDNFCRVSGYSREEVLGQDHRIINSGFHSPSFFEEMFEQIEQGNSWHREIRNRCKDGSAFWLDTHIVPFVNAQGVVAEYITLSKDITERKLAEREVAQKNQLLEQAYGIARMGHWVRESVIITSYASPELLCIYGVSQEQYDKDPALLHRMTHPEDQDEVISKLEESFLLKVPYECEHRIIKRDGQVRWFYHKATIKEIDDEFVLVGITQDNTELIEYRRNLEEKVSERTRELDEALQKERELTEMKTRFVNTASHEFRTPLSTISIAAGFLRKYREKITTESYYEKLTAIERQVRIMTRLLDDILLVGRTESGKNKPTKTTIALDPFVRQVARQVEEVSGSHMIHVHTQHAPLEVISDEKLLLNVLINLLTNAIKFSPDQRAIQLRVSGSNDDLRIEVEDHGIGIPPEDLDGIFKTFQRGTNVGSIPGTGLGLSIVKEAVALLKGTVSLESTAGKGTTFTVMLPQHLE